MRYSEKIMSVDFQEADVGPIFRLLADVASLNLVLDPSVKGRIRIKLLSVPWWRVLNIVLEQTHLSHRIEDNILWIAPRSVFDQIMYEKARSKEIEERAEELVQEVVRVNYARCEEIQAVIINGKLLSPRGTIVVDLRGNALILKDTQKSINNLKELLRHIDVPVVFPSAEQSTENLEEEKKKTADELLFAGEGSAVEFKASLRWDVRQKKTNVDLQKSVAKTIAGFLNSSGGNLFIGVADDKTICGLADDIKTLGRRDIDGFQQKLVEILTNYIGGEFMQYIRIEFIKIADKDICLIRTAMSRQPVYVKKGDDVEFYIKAGNTARKLNVKEAHEYIKLHWER